MPPAEGNARCKGRCPSAAQYSTVCGNTPCSLVSQGSGLIYDWGGPKILPVEAAIQKADEQDGVREGPDGSFSIKTTRRDNLVSGYL